MRKGLTFAALLLILVAGSTAFAQAGKDVFSAKCVMCHGADASANTPMGKNLKIPDLRSPEVQKKSDAELETIISKGKNKMPAYEGKLSKEQIAQVTAYIRDLGKKK